MLLFFQRLFPLSATSVATLRPARNEESFSAAAQTLLRGRTVPAGGKASLNWTGLVAQQLARKQLKTGSEEGGDCLYR